VIHRTESNDLWAYYQAKKIRENQDEVALTLLGTLTADPGKAAAAAQKLDAQRAKYSDDAKDLMKEDQAKDTEQKLEEGRALKFDIGEGLLELGLVLCSLFFLAKRAFFPVLGILASVAGAALGIWGWML
jgi:hypothetical protein